jgi:hypothetical protein
METSDDYKDQNPGEETSSIKKDLPEAVTRTMLVAPYPSLYLLSPTPFPPLKHKGGKNS